MVECHPLDGKIILGRHQAVVNRTRGKVAAAETLARGELGSGRDASAIEFLNGKPEVDGRFVQEVPGEGADPIFSPGNELLRSDDREGTWPVEGWRSRESKPAT
ncbi:hypothetical protein [Paracoccus benzoatiresistens]|uniref:Uncharacterized protein n=1 Tax=Paracoccus benzoatiresistens TaxID=2997341 RepID=A0ABT4JBL9_9RHOB|nr:hypothetical protein [Paracoccus sp. EF6]MCZ0964085.1 hypothetical protein [Paracoccus sp. EF6]